MRKHHIENAAFEVATQVRTVEDTIDQALAEMAELQSRLVHAKTVTGIGVASSHAAFEQLACAVSALVSARGGMANCHGALVAAKQFVPGLRAVGFGDTECPPETAAGGLRVVA
jgi:hypothetical protein